MKGIMEDCMCVPKPAAVRFHVFTDRYSQDKAYTIILEMRSVRPDDFPGKSSGCRRLTWKPDDLPGKSFGQCRDDASVTCSVWRMVVERWMLEFCG
ncbi:hypothetical protein DY000_02060718 [Brassica cretica]|uniref:Uncharacterized protein n=1 Tax=Brassica cretica TaxID=69181 RepID=A0ABQ7B0C9_BRACR|nr:hypothetical protein DY000_02060718 [Brassica cretica]